MCNNKYKKMITLLHNLNKNNYMNNHYKKPVKIKAQFKILNRLKKKIKIYKLLKKKVLNTP